MERDATGGTRTAASGEAYVAVGYLAFLVFAWGGNYTWVKIAMRDIGPLWFNVARYGGAVLVLAAIFLALGRGLSGPRGILPVRGERLALALVGLLQVGLMTTMTALAMRWIEASRVVLIAYTVPVWALLWGAAILGERITLPAAVGAVLGLAGLAILTDPLNMDWEAAVLPGTLVALVGVNGWALGAVLYRRRKWQSGFWPQTFLQVAATAAGMLLLAPLIEDPTEARLSGPVLAVILYNIFVPCLLGFFCWIQALSRIPAHAAGQILILAPIYGVAQSHLVLDEPLGAGLVLACLLVVAGAWLTLRRPRSPPVA